MSLVICLVVDGRKKKVSIFFLFLKIYTYIYLFLVNLICWKREFIFSSSLLCLLQVKITVIRLFIYFIGHSKFIVVVVLVRDYFKKIKKNLLWKFSD